MKSFADVGAFAAFLLQSGPRIHDAQQRGLHDGAELIHRDAQARIGNYQEAVGPFPKWAPLAESTLEGWGGHPGKVELGYAPPDNPLMREGGLHESIVVDVAEGEAVIGSASPIAVYQEMGTPGAKAPIPPRPFLGPAGFTKAHDAADAVAKAVIDALAGKVYRPK